MKSLPKVQTKVNTKNGLISKKITKSKVIKDLEQIKMSDFNKMNEADKIQILYKYGKHSKWVEKYCSKYYKSPIDVVRLSKENFDSILLFACFHVVEKHNESIKNKNKARKGINLKHEKLNFDTITKMFGYLFRAFRNNYTKEYSKTNSIKMANGKYQESLDAPIKNTESNSHDGANLNSDIYLKDKTNSYEVAEHSQVMDLLYKVLEVHDKQNGTIYLELFKEMQKENSWENVSELFNLSTYDLKKRFKNIPQIIMESSFLKEKGISSTEILEAFKDVLFEKMNNDELCQVQEDFKPEEKMNNLNFQNKKLTVQEVVSTDYKNKKYVITLSVIDLNENSKSKDKRFTRIEEKDIPIPMNEKNINLSIKDIMEDEKVKQIKLTLQQKHNI